MRHIDRQKIMDNYLIIIQKVACAGVVFISGGVLAGSEKSLGAPLFLARPCGGQKVGCNLVKNATKIIRQY